MDHRDEWHEGGVTDPTNADPYCGHHNRLKHRHRHKSRSTIRHVSGSGSGT